MAALEKCVVFYECWQIECCGKQFSKGDTVKWLVVENEEGCRRKTGDFRDCERF